MKILNSSGWRGEFQISIEFKDDNGVVYKTIFDREKRIAVVERKDKAFTERQSAKCPDDNIEPEISPLGITPDEIA